MKRHAFAGALVAGVFAVDCSTNGVSVPEGTPSADLLIAAAGSGTWTLACTGTSERGRTAASNISGRGSRSNDVIALRGMISASCQAAATDAPLTLTLDEAGMACPFGGFEGGVCRTVISAGESANYEFTPA